MTDLKKNINLQQAKDTGMAMVLICLLAGIFTDWAWCYTLATLLLVVNMIWPTFYNPVAKVWLGLTLTVYNVSGQVVGVLEDEYQQAGNHSIIWDATNMPSGLYFCTLKANGGSETRKMLLEK